jgi:acyl-CoA thioesterase-2
MPGSAADLVALFDLERIETDIFRGYDSRSGWKRVFGGQVIAQALVAAQRTVEGRAPHSLHAYFLLGGDPEAPIVYQVERIRDGRSFTTRRVIAIQHGKPIFALSASFQLEENGLEHALPMPIVADPDQAPDPVELLKASGRTAEAVRSFFERIRPVVFRPVDLSRYMPMTPGVPREAKQSIWIKIDGRLPDDPAVHRAALAFMSDMTLLDTALAAHGRHLYEAAFQVASLDHALWLHRPFRADEWLLYAQDSPSAAGARAMTRGLIYSREGALIATVAQEGLIRPRTPKAP